ncbi:MAG: 2'-5' RNA ligase family protein [Rubrobacteraceae bacterium]
MPLILFCYSSLMEDYARTWKDFVSGGTLDFGGHMEPGWQDGHTLSASLIVPVDVSTFEPRLRPMRSVLRTLPFVSLHPDYFMHITLLPLGFLVPQPEKKLEISPERLTEVEMNARSALKDFPAFEIEFANLNAFPGAAFVEVYDGGRLNELRDRICAGCDIEAPAGTPHLTLAYFQAPEGTAMPPGFASSLGQFRSWPVGNAPVDYIDLTLLDLKSGYPEPNKVSRIPLGGK